MAFFDLKDIRTIFTVTYTCRDTERLPIGITESLEDAYKIAQNYIDVSPEGEQFEISLEDLTATFKTGKNYEKLSTTLEFGDWFSKDHRELDRQKYYFTITKTATSTIELR